MIVKAYIESILDNGRYKIRIPTIDKVQNSSLSIDSLSVAEVCSVINNGLSLNLNDVVYVDFENDDKSKPVIIGCLSKSGIESSYELDSLKVSDTANLPSNISIGDISYSELSCLIGTTGNIEEQLSSIESSIDGINNNLIKLNNTIENIDSDINNINLKQLSSKIEYIDDSIGKEQDKNNETFYGKYNDLIEKSSKIENFIGTPSKAISLAVDELLTRLISLTDNTPISSSEDSDLSSTIFDEENNYNYANSDDFKDIIKALRDKFPHGKYWNHSPIQGNTSYNGKNNQDGWTNIPCPKHGNCGTSSQTCNGYAPNGLETSWQCMGYAYKCGFDVTGFDPQTSSMWKYTENSDYLRNLKAGDIVRYKNGGHSIYVIDVNENVVTYTDCNSDGHCMICWDSKIDKSDIKKSFSYVFIAPTDLSNSRLLKR